MCAKASMLFEDLVADEPKRKEVKFPMVVDSSVETGVEIETGIGSADKVGWVILGFDWFFVDTAADYHRFDCFAAGAGDETHMLQLCRGELPDTPVILRGGDNDLLMESIIHFTHYTGVGAFIKSWPEQVRKNAYTQQDKLHFTYGSRTDIAHISTVDVSIYAEIFYIPVKARNARGDHL